MPGDFVHLHVHSQYSMLDGAIRIDKLCKAVKDDGMHAVALTDHGNMYGAMQLYKSAKNAGIKPIIGCEVYFTTDDTLARVRAAADKDAHALDPAAYTGRYIHLLIRQTPNKPAWALRDGETVTWEAVALGQGDEGVLLAFSSLPKAVSFMQPAVLRGAIVGVSKVAKFSRETAAGWLHRLLLNPDVSVLDGRGVTFVPIDPASAETPDE